MVLAAQTRLIWRIAHVYYQRPSLRDFAQLYANVASTAFIAAGIEDIDVDVLVGTIFGSTVAAIPGMHLLASSVLLRISERIPDASCRDDYEGVLSLHDANRKERTTSGRNTQSRETARFHSERRDGQTVKSGCERVRIES